MSGKKKSGSIRANRFEKFRGVVFRFALHREFKEWTAVLNPDVESKRIEIRIHRMRGEKDSPKPRHPFVFQVVGKTVRETGSAGYLQAAFECVTSLAFSHCPEQPTQYHPRLRKLHPVKMPT